MLNMTLPTGPGIGARTELRRCRWSAAGMVLPIVVALGTGCGPPRTDVVDKPAPGTVVLSPGDQEPVLTCTGDERASSFITLAEDARGAPTARGAVDEFASGQSAVVSASGSRAWILRGDGTAETKLGLFKGNGWFVTGTTGC